MEQDEPSEEVEKKPLDKTAAWTILMLLRTARGTYPGKDPMETIEATVVRMETRLGQWGARLEQFSAKAAEAGNEARTDYSELLADLTTKYQRARAKLDELKVAGTDKWEGLRAGIETAWADLETAFENLAD